VKLVGDGSRALRCIVHNDSSSYGNGARWGTYLGGLLAAGATGVGRATVANFLWAMVSEGARSEGPPVSGLHQLGA
jgi:hypothetical protein